MNNEFQHKSIRFSKMTMGELLQAFYNEEPKVYRRATQALSKISSIALGTELIQALNDPSSHVPGRAAWLLGQMGTHPVITALLQSLNHEACQVRRWAVWTLGQIDNQTAVTGLLQALVHQDSSVRGRAVSALGTIYAGKRSHKEADKTLALDSVLAKLNERDYYVRGRAALALGRIGQETVVAPLLQLLNDQNAYVRGSAASALGQIGSNIAVPGLLKALEYQSVDVIQPSMKVVEGNVTPDAIAGMLQTIQEQDFRVNAVKALGKIGTPEAVNALVKLLSERDSYVRHAVVSALGQIRSEVATNGLMEALNDENSSRSMASAVANGQFVSTQGVSVQPIPSNVPPNTEPLNLPKIFITSCEAASEHLLCATRGPLVKHLISIGSPGAAPPDGYTRISHRLRLEFDDIYQPQDDPKYVLATWDDILKVIQFTREIPQSDGNILIHCHEGISRSAAVALTLYATLLGPGKEEAALAYVLAAQPEARPNPWVIELADAALDRDGKLLELV